MSDKEAVEIIRKLLWWCECVVAKLPTGAAENLNWRDINEARDFLKGKAMTPNMDKKYLIAAVKMDGSHVPVEESILFRAKDRALLPTLKFYAEECERIGASEEHVEVIQDLIDRVFEFQKENGNKIPD
jgi:hypothetical protein